MQKKEKIWDKLAIICKSYLHYQLAVEYYMRKIQIVLKLNDQSGSKVQWGKNLERESIKFWWTLTKLLWGQGTILKAIRHTLVDLVKSQIISMLNKTISKRIDPVFWCFFYFCYMLHVASHGQGCKIACKLVMVNVEKCIYLVKEYVLLKCLYEIFLSWREGNWWKSLG